MSNNEKPTTILDRPFGLRIIGLTQMAFGVFGLLAAVGVLVASIGAAPAFATVGPLYALLIFVGVALPCLIIGNYVDDLRRNAVIAQAIYSIIAVGLTGYFLLNWGVAYSWTVPWFELSFNIQIGNVAVFVLATQAAFLFYMLIYWDRIAPPPGTVVVRDRRRARLIEEGLMAVPLTPSMLSSDGSELSPDEARRILDIRKVTTPEGMAILCSNCDGATPLTKMEGDNTVACEYCGVTLAVSSVFVPCEDHPEYLAATNCAVCGEHYCRRCLTAQDPPIDTRWKGSTVYLCRNCFEGRYRPAVTTTSLVLPIEDLFGQAGGRFSKVGGMYRRFLGAYGSAMAKVFRASLEIFSAFGRSGGGASSGGGSSCGGGGGGAAGAGGGDDCCGAILVIIIIIIAIPILVGLVMLLGAVVIVPILFYAGLIGVTIEAIRIIRKTDFVSLEQAREKGLLEGRKVEVEKTPVRNESRPWMDDQRVRETERQYERVRARERKEVPADSFWRRY
ncbi:MAG: hypothetical protein ACW960_05930 [Candidatus Thorarchaeota archaeon]